MLERLAPRQVQGRPVPDRSAGSSGSTWSGSTRSSSSMPRRSISIPRRRSSRSVLPRITPASWPERFGPFHTTGMVEDHAGLSNERFGEEAFLDQCETAWHEREAMMLHELERFDEGLFYCLFDTPDRVQHLFWRFREPDHPANRGEPARPSSPAWSRTSTAAATTIVGKALEFADDETLVIALSDHGFNSFQRGVHLNSWLRDHGLLALRAGARARRRGGDLFRGVDWSRTRAYALGLGGIYLNLEGREGQGIVKPDEAEALKADDRRGLGRPARPRARRRGHQPRPAPRGALPRPLRRRVARPARPLRRGLSRLVGIVARRSARRALRR